MEVIPTRMSAYPRIMTPSVSATIGARNHPHRGTNGAVAMADEVISLASSRPTRWNPTHKSLGSCVLRTSLRKGFLRFLATGGSVDGNHGRPSPSRTVRRLHARDPRGDA